MNFLKRLFSKSSEDFLSKGEALLASERFFEARTSFEEGLRRHLETSTHAESDEVAKVFGTRIAIANRELASLNIVEAESAFRQGLLQKAQEHLELAKTLTDDGSLREKADRLHNSFAEKSSVELISNPVASGCGSCASKGHGGPADAVLEEHDMAPADYYDLLIRQLPEEMYKRYAGLGEEFAYFYIIASREDNEKALVQLDEWFKDEHSDIYLYEKGKVLYRLGRVDEAEKCFLDSISQNNENSLAHLGQALLLIDAERLDEAAAQLDDMINRDMLPEQTHLLRGEVCMLAGDTARAINIFGGLLQTPVARPAAERLHNILLESGRQQEAAMVYKKYLGGCCH